MSRTYLLNKLFRILLLHFKHFPRFRTYGVHARDNFHVSDINMVWMWEKHQVHTIDIKFLRNNGICIILELINLAKYCTCKCGIVI